MTTLDIPRLDLIPPPASARPTATDAFLADVLSGLRRPRKELPCKYFYDERGSRLFDAICDLPEYYVTRTELALMQRHAADMAASLGPDLLLIELGSGSSVKTRLVLDHLGRPAAYVPVDVSREHLLRSSAALAADYPGLEVLPLAADFTADLALPRAARPARRRVVYFPGSTLGNFAPPEAERLLTRVARLVGPGGGLLLGLDLRKDLAVLEPAYDDAQGVTAAFNLNLLARINRELDGDFDLSSFRHQAPYNPARHCIEMHLVSTRAQTARVAGHAVRFAAGETILTERSHKYDLDEFRAWVPRTGLHVARHWTDDRRWFAILELLVTTP